MMTALTVVGWNMRRDRRGYRADVVELIAAHRPDVILLQEAQDAAADLAVVARTHGYAHYQPTDKRGQVETAILARTDLAPRFATRKASRTGWITIRGGTTPPKWLHTVQIGDTQIGDTHLPPTVDWTNGKPTGPRRRVKVYEQMQATHAAWVRATVKAGRSVFLHGDWNESPFTLGRSAPRTVALALGLDRSHTRRGTHGNGHGAPIDYALHSRDVWHVHVTRSPVRTGSDHLPVLYTLTPKKKGTPMPPTQQLDPYAIVRTDGKKLDRHTRQALTKAERILGYNLTIVQGSYNAGGVGASAGTHDGGGAVDLLAWDWERKVRALRQVGFAAWYRPAIRGLWGAHIHAILIGNKRLSSSAARQVTAYYNGRDGLAGNRPDTFWRPNPIPTYQFDPAGVPPFVPPPKPEAPAPTPPAGGLPVHGIDLARYQNRPIAWSTLKKAGVLFAYIKATEGVGYGYQDYYDGRVREARAAGIVVGAYHFARPSTTPGDAVAEAREFIRRAKPRPGDLRPALDLEDSGGLTDKQLADWAAAFCAEVTKRAGARPVIYTPFTLDQRVANCPLWVARYSNVNAPPRIPGPWKAAAIRQFSDGRYGRPSRIPGLPDPTDLNTLPGGPATLAALLIPEPAPAPKTRGGNVDAAIAAIDRALGVHQAPARRSLLESARHKLAQIPPITKEKKP